MTAALVIVTALSALFGVAGQTDATPQQPASKTPARGPSDIASIAASMPKIEPKDGVISIPLATSGVQAWRPIRDGINVQTRQVAVTGSDTKPAATADQLEVSYTRTRGKPAGAALVIRPGTLAGLKSLDIRMRSKRMQTLSITLQDTEGVVWTFPSLSLNADESLERSLKVEDIEPDAFQNSGKVQAKFDPAKVIMITVLDIGGYMSITEPECRWAVSTMRGVCR